ncbi:outer membrane beta-barrel protein [Colwelliaceae bacterium 6471]
MRSFYLSSLACILCSTIVFADASSVSIAGPQDQSLSGNVFSLNLATEAGNIDNFLYQNSDVSSTYYTALSPSLILQSQFERSLFQLNAKTSHYKYGSFSADDHSDFNFSGKYQYKLSAINTLFADGIFDDSYEYRGMGLTLGVPNSIDKGNTKNVIKTEVGYIHGNIDSVAKLKLTLGMSKSKYTTQRTLTNILDTKHQYIEGEFDYLLSNQIYFSSVINIVDVNYSENELMNRQEYAALIGTKWQPSAITNVEVLIGYQKINVDEIGQDKNTISWRSNITWAPLTYTKFRLGSARSVANSSKLENSYSVIDSHSIAIGYDISDRLNTRLQLGVKIEDINYSDNSVKEKYYFSNFSINYQWQEWLSFFARYNFEQLNANDELLDHNRNSVSVGFNVNI